MSNELLEQIATLQKEFLSQHRRYAEEHLELVRRQVANQDRILKTQRLLLRIGAVVLAIWIVAQIALVAVTN